MAGGARGGSSQGFAHPSAATDHPSNFFRQIYRFLNGQYFFDIIYNHYIINKGLKFGYTISKVLDRGIIEIVGPFGLSNVLQNTGFKLAKLDTGVITTYSLYINLGLLSLVFLVFSPILFYNYLIILNLKSHNINY